MTSPATAALALLPTDPRANLAYRRKRLLNPSKADRKTLWQLCSLHVPEACLFWTSAFAWTYRQQRSTADGTRGWTGIAARPFILWPYQLDLVRELWTAIDEGHDCLVDKSRDMGATWLCLIVPFWFWLFEEDSSFLIASRKQTLVENPGDMDALFSKLDFLLEHLPSWMRPPMGRRDRRQMHMRNPATRSVIDGECTVEDIGRGGRRKAILLDEFAAWEHGEAAYRATSDTTPCRLFNSTPKGRGNAFADIRFSGKCKIITLHWHLHPEKGRDAQQLPDAQDRLRWTSPWYEAECRRRASKQDIGENLDIDYVSSGGMFFDGDVLQRIRGSGNLREADLRGELSFSVQEREGAYAVSNIQWVPDGGRLRLWCPLVADRQGQLRPTQKHNYVAGCDISNGSGDSNSVCSVWDMNTHEQVGEFADPRLLPEQFADYCVALWLWFGGQIGYVFAGWEANGPGGIFGRRVVQLGYPYFFRPRDEKRPVRKRQKALGWWSSRDTKRIVLGEYRRALGADEIIPHSEPGIAEAERYVNLPTGGIGPGKFADMDSGARETHGDRVIADAVARLCMLEQPKAEPPKRIVVPGYHSFEARTALLKQQEKAQETW